MPEGMDKGTIRVVSQICSLIVRISFAICSLTFRLAMRRNDELKTKDSQTRILFCHNDTLIR